MMVVPKPQTPVFTDRRAHDLVFNMMARYSGFEYSAAMQAMVDEFKDDARGLERFLIMLDLAGLQITRKYDGARPGTKEKGVI